MSVNKSSREKCEARFGLKFQTPEPREGREKILHALETWEQEREMEDKENPDFNPDMRDEGTSFRAIY